MFSFFGLMHGNVCAVVLAAAKEIYSLFSGRSIHYIDRLDLAYCVI